MTLFSKLILSFWILLAASFASADNLNPQAETNSTTAQELNQEEANAQAFMQLMAKFTQATLAAGRCTGSYDCSWPYSSCKNGNCERP